MAQEDEEGPAAAVVEPPEVLETPSFGGSPVLSLSMKHTSDTCTLRCQCLPDQANCHPLLSARAAPPDSRDAEASRHVAEPPPELEQAAGAASSIAPPGAPAVAAVGPAPAFSEWVAAHSDVTDTTPEPVTPGVPPAVAMTAAEVDVIVAAPGAINRTAYKQVGVLAAVLPPPRREVRLPSGLNPLALKLHELCMMSRGTLCPAASRWCPPGHVNGAQQG